MKDLGDLHYFLAIEVIQPPDHILLSRRHYVLNILYTFRMTECRPICRPLDQNQKLHPDFGPTYDEERF